MKLTMSPQPIWCLVALVLLSAAPRCDGVGIEDVVDILNYGKTLAVSVFKSWDLVKDLTDKPQRPGDTEIDLPILRTKEKKVMARLAEVSRQIDKLDAKMQTYSTGAINILLRELPSKIRLEIRLESLSSMIAKVDVASAQLKRYIYYNNETDAKEWSLERHTVENYAEWVVSHESDSVLNLVEGVHGMIAPEGENEGVLGRGVLHLLKDTMQESGSNLCSLQQSPQQLLYNVYSTAALTELKGFAMMQFSWMLLRLYGKGNFTLEARIMRERYQERTLQKIAAVKSAMTGARRDIYRCDPKQHVEGETYVQLTRLLQGHVQNEVDLNGEQTCRENCAYYSYTKSHGCYHNLYCAAQQKCNGKLIDCRYYDSDMWICQAPKDSVRRYEWIEYENGRTLGKKEACQRGGGSTKVDSWWRWVFWHCSYCFCLCDEQGPKSDRYFNLRSVTADTQKNMVVTGLRIVKRNRIIHLQIQQAALMPRGGINASTIAWRPVDDYRITDGNVASGEDYHTLSWEQRAFDLDDLYAPEGHVLTGIRFRRVGTHLNPEIQATPLNFTSGTLIEPSGTSVWIGNDNTDASLSAPRTQLRLADPDVPTRSPAPLRPRLCPRAVPAVRAVERRPGRGPDDRAVLRRPARRGGDHDGWRRAASQGAARVRRVRRTQAHHVRLLAAHTRDVPEGPVTRRLAIVTTFTTGLILVRRGCRE